MRLDQLPDWLTLLRPMIEGGVLKSANSFQLGHVIILDIERQGSHHVKLLEVPPQHD